MIYMLNIRLNPRQQCEVHRDASSMRICFFTITRTERVISYAPVIQSSCTTAMASAIPVEDSPITSVKIETRLADSESSFQASSCDQSELGIADHICMAVETQVV